MSENRRFIQLFSLDVFQFTLVDAKDQSVLNISQFRFEKPINPFSSPVEAC